MHVLFWVSASPEIGTGHLMRCRTLADALTSRGDAVTWLSRLEPARLAQGLPGCVQAVSDTASALAALSTLDAAPDWLVVDDYGLDATVERAALERLPPATRLMVIDDLANRPHAGHLLLDANYLPDADIRYAGLLPPGCRCLLGPDYALLRPSIAEARPTVRPASAPLQRVLVSLGGSDPDNVTARILDGLTPWLTETPGAEAMVILGAANRHAGGLLAAWGGHPQLTLKPSVPDLAPWLAWADVVIGAGGTTTWERAALGRFTLLVTLADNQVAVARQAIADGLAYDLAWGNGLTPEAVRAGLVAVATHPEWREHAATYGPRRVDGLGVQRVVAVLTAEDVIDPAGTSAA